jgi:energy-coupling factor transporter transmembrane protein EcfT
VTLNWEFSFKAEDRHFRPGIALLLLAMVILGVFGVVLPIRKIAFRNPAFLLGYRGVVLALIAVFGYVLTDMGHYGLFKLPKYRINSEGILFAARSACSVLS